MDLLHEELKEPVPPVVTRQELSTKKPANKVTARSKRLLGGQTMGHNQNGELTKGNLMVITSFGLGASLPSIVSYWANIDRRRGRQRRR